MSPTTSPDTPATGNGGGETAVDWTGVRERLARLSAATVAGSQSAAERDRLLAERADVLARIVAPKNDEGETVSVLEFRLGAERYAVENAAVREVHVLREITPVPGTPDFILGVVIVRGRICSVVDLARVFDLPARERGARARVVVLADGAMEFGIVADEVVGMRAIATVTLQDSLPTMTGTRQKYLRGVTPERIAVLDARRLLADKTLVVRDDAGSAR
jgi:purine-binding chemotaxis protein CheW